MRKKRLLITLLSIMMTILLVCGCSAEGVKIKYEPKEGDKLVVDAHMVMSQSSGDVESMSMDMNMGLSSTYTKVSNDEIVSEQQYDSITGNMNMLGQTIDFETTPEMKEVFDKIKSAKITITQDGKGNVKDMKVDGIDEISEDSFDFSSYSSEASSNAALFDDVNFKEGETIEIPLKKLIDKSTATQLGIDDNAKIKIKATKVTDKIVEGEAVTTNLKSENAKFDLKLNFTVDVKKGLCTNLNYDIKIKADEISEMTMKLDMKMKLQ